eukprot:14269924-Alexandrium_andersonii.AAC.1
MRELRVNARRMPHAACRVPVCACACGLAGSSIARMLHALLCDAPWGAKCRLPVCQNRATTPST